PAPMFSRDSSTTRALSLSSPPCLPWDWRQAASGTPQSGGASRPSPLARAAHADPPTLQPPPAPAEGFFLALVRAGDETVQRDRDMTPKLAHRASSAGGVGSQCRANGRVFGGMRHKATRWAVPASAA